MSRRAREIDVEGALVMAEEALASGTTLAVLDDLAELSRLTPDPRLHRVLVDLRHQAFDELDRHPGRSTWPPELADPFPGREGIAEISPPDLSPGTLGGALVNHGCLRVNGLLPPERAAGLAADIERVFEARERVLQGAPPESAAPLFVPFPPGQAKAGGFGAGAFVRAVDAPRVLDDLVADFAGRGVLDAITGYFGERPAMIANKWVLRRTMTGKVGTDFHQDGAFLGDGIRTVDCWIALTRCGPGTGRPAMDLVPTRFRSVLPSGEDAAFNWSVSEEDVRAAARDTPIVSPVFEPGDALFFDELLPHRTTVGLDLGVRYAVESWFVAPSSYPSKHVPVVV